MSHDDFLQLVIYYLSWFFELTNSLAMLEIWHSLLYIIYLNIHQRLNKEVMLQILKSIVHSMICPHNPTHLI